jgi:hypothetical protein
MRQVKSYYCWFKQVDLDDAAKEEEDGVPRLGGIPRAGGRPPKRIVGKLGFTDDGLGADDLGDDLAAPSSSEFTHALTLSWAADIVFPGDPLSLMRYRIIPAKSRDEALAWITESGRKWASDAKQLFLMCFAMNGPKVIRPELFGVPDKHHVAESQGYKTFDKESWDGEFRREAFEQTFFTKRAWTGFDLSAPFNGVKGKAEYQVVGMEAEMAKVTTEAQKVEIRKEHLSSWSAVLGLLKMAGVANRYAEHKLLTITLIGRLIEETLPPLAFYKASFNVMRPREQFPNEQKKPLVSVPRHPSYPSGHATQAFVVAKGLVDLLKAQGTKLETDLLDFASKIGNRRVAAGLHYPIDVEGGLQLGSALFAEIEKTDAYTALRDRARNENSIKQRNSRSRRDFNRIPTPLQE